MRRHSFPPRILASALLLCFAPLVFSQQSPHSHDHGEVQHLSDNGTMKSDSDGRMPVESGQDAFAAVQEIVTILENDPETDWSRVDINALREHLIDMHRVTLDARVRSENVEGGARHHIRGDSERTVAAIQRMVPAHAAWMNANSPWSVESIQQPGGIELVVRTSDPGDERKVRALGFMGFMALGSHHQPHHLAVARGEAMHTDPTR
ncbi:hypothetical protein [Marinobacter zhanjiangensis]|uniref:Zinc transport system substrate-binding protein n=1 Tax=Marinobacter zhanjiangensis TaxID=578215 RepID=A0ABQ3AS35_9GAMM|nr:hypothetical protein [Marinobacter zhanjiangensis]GGY66115.1 hypothetical protein GCM10007071_11130 [Marinobacter zhanjiangensis]